MKIASSLDGRSATHTGESRWITGDAARAYGHRLRSAHDAILTGIGTVLSDDPSLTCRLPGLESRSPVRVVIDSFLKIPPASKLVATGRETPLWILTLESQKTTPAFQTLEAAGARMICLPPAGRRIDLSLALTALAEEGITRLLVEAGGQVSGAFLEAGFVDRIHWFRAPMLIGSKGQSAVASELPALLSSLPRYTRERTIPLGADILETYRI